MEVNKVASAAQLHLPPGFRFHPTDEELVVHYLARRAASKSFPIPIIAEVDLYKYDPWELPEKALFGEKEWYFFSPRDRKYPNGARPNRAAGSGYWKATGTDKPIASHGAKAGVKKALVFYRGRAPKGVKTNWIMHEYRLAESSAIAKASSIRKKGTLRLDDWVLCRIYKKNATCPTQKSLQQQVGVAGAHGTAKLDADDESCLEEVLASLPDIDESRMCLPRLGSFTAMLSTDHGNASQVNNIQQLIGKTPNQATAAAAAGSETGSVRSYNDSVVDNCLLDSRCNLPSLRQQQEFYSLQQEMKPNIFYNGMHVAGAVPGVGNNRFNSSNKHIDSYEDEVQSSCKFVGGYDQSQFVNSLSRIKFHQQQQQQQHRQHNFTDGQLSGYFFQQS